jgi:replication fork clamp-binding protein CrfC
MEKLIPLINRLQDALGTVNTKLDLSLPQIVVVGAQSAGKSSVLESIVGRDFLPRGSGIVTRRPLVLQLIQTQLKEEWGEFSHHPNKKFKDFDKIRLEIEVETERLLGKKANISNQEIFLKIYSPNVLDVTLVDLPGLTKVPVGDQPADIEFQIREMILTFIRNPNSIILAISNANQDLANSDSLKLAREIDPEGNRTLGVITKIDLMDRGTDAMEMLKGKLYPLKLGYVGVVCRSQADINENKTIKAHLEDEKRFFQTHEKYRVIAHTMGIPHLSWKLNKLLMSHIKAALPDLKKRVNEMMRSNEEQLRTYGYPLDGNPDFQGMIMLNVITSYSTYYSNAIEGKTLSDSNDELEGGAKIRDILLRKFINNLKLIDALDGTDDIDIKTAIDSAVGVRSTFFIPSSGYWTRQ